MLAKEKKDEVKEFLKDSPHIRIRDVALLFDITYAQAYALNKEVNPKPKPKKKPAVKAKAKMSRKTILEKAGEQMRVAVKKLTDQIDSEPQLAHYSTAEPRIYEQSIDLINQPPHYTKGGIETIDFIEAKDLNYNLGNVVKYVSRSGLKGTRIEDLKKAKWYLEREISSLLGD